MKWTIGGGKRTSVYPIRSPQSIAEFSARFFDENEYKRAVTHSNYVSAQVHLHAQKWPKVKKLPM